MINDIITSIEDRITASFQWLFDPLVYWFGAAFVILLVLLTITYFLPLKTVRIAAGGILVMVGAFLAGGVQMHKIMKKKLQEEKEKARQEKERQRQRDGGIFGNWFQ
ncbi:hypothetical protein [Bradyrhizobium sp. Leo121]|uniref:hypothetical protein n=1 Tax=Bradyrhizobium sp. Leo121 TaxID=1571195 RepID=UPI001028A426|nr:hypothetical protein [Bradyrhizobium sp. Leo121]